MEYYIQKGHCWTCGGPLHEVEMSDGTRMAQPCPMAYQQVYFKGQPFKFDHFDYQTYHTTGTTGGNLPNYTITTGTYDTLNISDQNFWQSQFPTSQTSLTQEDLQKQLEEYMGW